MKAAASILFAFLLLWHPATAANAAGPYRSGMAMTCAGCCCCRAPVSESSSPIAPVPSRPASEQQLTLLLPTITASLLLEQSAETSKFPSLTELSASAGALPLFRRDCALLL